LYHHEECYYGYIEKGKIILSDWGEIAEQCWNEIPIHFPWVSLDKYMVMPNHVHGILRINDNFLEINGGRGVQLNAPTAKIDYFSKISPSKYTLGVVIRTYKAAVTTLCNRNSLLGFSCQRNYYDRVSRNENELRVMRNYIINNPINWAKDEFYRKNG
jgi:REP element-mobilizing transposase RayT